MRSRLHTLCLGLPLLAGLLPGLAPAAEKLQDHASIRDAARVFAEGYARVDKGSTQVQVDSLDSRLRLARCDRPLEAFAAPSTKRAGRTVIGVRCDGAKPWSLYVPLKIQVMKQVVVLRHPMPKDSIISEDDVTQDIRDISRMHRGYYSDSKRVIGKRTKRALKLDTVLTPANLVSPETVKRGALVTIVADNGSFQVRTRGKALTSGQTGERIRVQNMNSKRAIEAEVIGPGIVQVTL